MTDDKEERRYLGFTEDEYKDFVELTFGTVAECYGGEPFESHPLAPKHTEESLRITIGLIGNKIEFVGKVRDRGRIEGVLQELLYVVGDLVEWELPGFPWLAKDDKPEG